MSIFKGFLIACGIAVVVAGIVLLSSCAPAFEDTAQFEAQEVYWAGVESAENCCDVGRERADYSTMSLDEWQELFDACLEDQGIRDEYYDTDMPYLP